MAKHDSGKAPGCAKTVMPTNSLSCSPVYKNGAVVTPKGIPCRSLDQEGFGLYNSLMFIIRQIRKNGFSAWRRGCPGIE